MDGACPTTEHAGRWKRRPGNRDGRKHSLETEVTSINKGMACENFVAKFVSLLPSFWSSFFPFSNIQCRLCYQFCSTLWYLEWKWFYIKSGVITILYVDELWINVIILIVYINSCWMYVGLDVIVILLSHRTYVISEITKLCKYMISCDIWYVWKLSFHFTVVILY